MDLGVTAMLAVAATAACVVLGFAAFALWVVARLDRDRRGAAAAARPDATAPAAPPARGARTSGSAAPR